LLWQGIKSVIQKSEQEKIEGREECGTNNSQVFMQSALHWEILKILVENLNIFRVSGVFTGGKLNETDCDGEEGKEWFGVSAIIN